MIPKRRKSIYFCVTVFDAHTNLEVSFFMTKNNYCYWLMATLMAGNRITVDERIMLNNFLRQRSCGSL